VALNSMNRRSVLNKQHTVKTVLNTSVAVISSVRPWSSGQKGGQFNSTKIRSACRYCWRASVVVRHRSQLGVSKKSSAFETS
jgi:hypothetical protein